MTIAQIKNEVARNFKYENSEPYKDWEELMLDCHGRKSIQLLRAIDESILLYHTRLLEEAGREFIGDDEIKRYVLKNQGYDPNASLNEFDYSKLGNGHSINHDIEIAKHIRSQASLLLASRKAEIERLKDEIKELNAEAVRKAQ